MTQVGVRKQVKFYKGTTSFRKSNNLPRDTNHLHFNGQPLGYVNKDASARWEHMECYILANYSLFQKVNESLLLGYLIRVGYFATLWLFGQTYYFITTNSSSFKNFTMVFYIPPQRSTIFVLNGNKCFDLFLLLFLSFVGCNFYETRAIVLIWWLWRPWLLEWMIFNVNTIK